jgi:hypothetical protein
MVYGFSVLFTESRRRRSDWIHSFTKYLSSVVDEVSVPTFKLRAISSQVQNLLYRVRKNMGEPQIYYRLCDQVEETRSG